MLLVQKHPTFFKWKIYIIFDHNALLSILYLIFWYFYNYFWDFELSLSVFHVFWLKNWVLMKISFFCQKTLFFTTKKSTFYKIFKKYSKIRYYGTTSSEGGPGSARTTKFRAADADLARTRLLKILKHKYLMFFYVLRMRVSPQNAVMQVTLYLQIGFFKFKKVFSE